jgi:hypothetical protein
MAGSVQGASPENSIELQFEPIHDGWSIYKAVDATIFRLKLLMMKLYLVNIDKEGNAQFQAAAQTFFTLSVPREHKGPKSERAYSPEEIADAVVDEDVKFDTVKEDWNEYKLPESAVISSKVILTQVAKTKLYDLTGDPVYRIQSQTIIKGNFPKGTREAFLQMFRGAA